MVAEVDAVTPPGAWSIDVCGEVRSTWKVTGALVPMFAAASDCSAYAV